jgi:hypothetical protein
MNAWLRAFLSSFNDGTSAAGRGMRLLKQNLTPEQLSQYEAYGYFDVVGGDTGHRFRIHRGEAMNIDEYDHTGGCVSRWCFLPVGHLVKGDVLLAQKMALELFEASARAVANKYPAHRPQDAERASAAVRRSHWRR